MSGTIRDEMTSHRNGSAPGRPQDLPHGLVKPPAELMTQVAQERAQFSPSLFTDGYAKRLLDDRTLAYYFAGFEVAYRSVPDGLEVLAVGVDEISALVRGKSQDELLSFTIKAP